MTLSSTSKFELTDTRFLSGSGCDGSGMRGGEGFLTGSAIRNGSFLLRPAAGCFSGDKSMVVEAEIAEDGPDNF